MERLFYMVDTENGYDSFVRNADQISVLGPQIYTVDSLGVIFGSIDPRVMRIANEKGIKVMPLMVNEGFNQPSLRKLLANPRARQRAIESMVRLCQDNGYWGLQFDVENVNIEDTDLFVLARCIRHETHRGGERFCHGYDIRSAHTAHTTGSRLVAAVDARCHDIFPEARPRRKAVVGHPDV